MGEFNSEGINRIISELNTYVMQAEARMRALVKMLEAEKREVVLQRDVAIAQLKIAAPCCACDRTECKYCYDGECWRWNGGVKMDGQKEEEKDGENKSDHLSD